MKKYNITSSDQKSKDQYGIGRILGQTLRNLGRVSKSFVYETAK